MAYGLGLPPGCVAQSNKSICQNSVDRSAKVFPESSGVRSMPSTFASLGTGVCVAAQKVGSRSLVCPG